MLITALISSGVYDGRVAVILALEPKTMELMPFRAASIVSLMLIRLILSFLFLWLLTSNAVDSTLRKRSHD